MITALTLVAACAIFWRSEAVLNEMGAACRLDIRLAFWLLAVGSFALILALSQGYRPSTPVMGLLWGVAILLINDRRIAGVLRPRDRRVRQ